MARIRRAAIDRSLNMGVPKLRKRDFGKSQKVLKNNADCRRVVLRKEKRRRRTIAELLLEKDELQKVWLLRKALSQLNPVEAMELLLDKLKMMKTNKDFLNQMNQLA
jgi:transcription termination factor Rho